MAMKKLLKRPETLLIAMALIFLACAVFAGYFYKPVVEGSKVIYVSEKDKANLIREEMVKSVIINLNTATQEELCLLEGIDTVTASAIIDYRNENGGFKSVDELKNVKGIGEIKFQNIRHYVCVE